jgi:hypothetical protein
MSDPTEKPDLTTPPPRAFTQGCGQVFQVVGVLLFLTMFFICCGSSLLSKDWAMKTDLTRIGWGVSSDAAGEPAYSAQRALTISVFLGVFFGIALAGVGLGMQAERPPAAAGATLVSLVGAVFWLVQTIFAATVTRSVLFTLIGASLTVLFVALLCLAVAAWKEMRANPPAEGHELLPADYKIPYSHYHDDPPEVRLAAELDQRRQRLVVQQKELEALEEKLRKKLDEDRRQERPS